jgi:hypothetical protein
MVPAVDKEQTLDYQTNHKCAGFFYKNDRASIDDWQIYEHRKHDLHRSLSSLSSRHRLSKTSMSDIQHRPPKSIENNSTEQSTVDPYAPAPNVIRVERIKDANSGADVFIRWVHDTKKAPEQVADHQSEKKLPEEIERLELDDKHAKKSRKKHKKRKLRDELLKSRHEMLNSSTTQLVPQQYPIPSYTTALLPSGTSGTFYTIEPPAQPDFRSASSPFWFYTM